MAYFGRIVVTVDLQRQGHGPEGGEFASHAKRSFEFPVSELEAHGPERFFPRFGVAVTDVYHEDAVANLQQEYQDALRNSELTPDKMMRIISILRERD